VSSTAPPRNAAKQTVEVAFLRRTLKIIAGEKNQETTTRRKFNDLKKAVNSLIKQAISRAFIHHLNVV
jgi:transcriptional regulator of met regulon